MASLEIWAGPAGSGKSRRVADAIRNRIEQDPLGPRLFWLVPEAGSYAAERALLGAVPASLRAEVLSLRRLAKRLLADVNPEMVPINRTGKRLLLAAVYQQSVQELQVLHRVEPSVPFLDAILDTFRELTEHLASPAEIAAHLEAAASRAGVLEGSAHPASRLPADELAASRSLFGKLRDLCLLYVRYRQELDARGLADDDELLLRAAAALPRWTHLAGAEVFVDGFTDLTPAEREFVLALAERSARAVLTLPLDREASQRAICPSAERVLRELSERVRELRLPFRIRHMPVPNRRYQHRPDLALVERYALADDHPETKLAATSIEVAAAQSRRVEADGIAAEIARLVHQEGYQYGDIAVIAPRLDEYATLLEERFAEHQIPCDSDVYPPLASHPLPRFIQAVLAAVEESCSLESMQRLLRTSFCPLSMAEADWLEVYLVRHEIEGVKVWAQAEAWRFSQQSEAGFRARESLAAEDARADELRRRIAGFLLPFLTVLASPRVSPDTVARQLWELLEQVHARAQMARWVVAGRVAEENPVAAGVHEQAWQKVLGLLDDFATTLPGRMLPRSFLCRLIHASLEGETLAAIPAGLNRVFISDHARAAGWERKVVFVAGAHDGALPLRVHETGLLRQEEREQFQQWFGRRLGGTLADRRAEARTAAYFALTRASERLYLSYPQSDADGRELRPARLLERLLSLFQEGSVRVRVERADGNAAPAHPPGVPGRSADDTLRPVPSTPTGALADTISRLRRGAADAVDRAVLRWHLERPRWAEDVAKVFGGLTQRASAAPLPPDLTRELYGQPLTVNVYQLETFAACPYRHFAEYGLRLREQELQDPTPALRGSLIHDALYALVQRLQGDTAAWRRMTDEAARAAARETFAEVLGRAQAQPWRRKAIKRQQAAEALAVIEDAAVVLTRHMRHGRFQPAFMELSFGDHEDDVLPLFEVSSQSGAQVRLRGRIDRVDVVSDGQAQGFRVVDYKSSVHTLDLTEVAHGLRLQLPIYTAVVARHSQELFGQPLAAAGMLYFPIRRTLPADTVPVSETEATERAYRDMRSRGWLLAQDDLVQAMDERLRKGGTELFPVVYTKDGSWRKSAPVLADDEWRALIGRAVGHAAELGERIAAGEIAVAPYDTGRKNACQHCPYQALCHLDVRWDARPLRRLEPFARERLREWSAYADWEGEASDGALR
ncbi:PD-(D/E)XK nuclease family protein [Alicyclobacillus kakegawensis]|uniref:PD-(D/E)XK nuclease family protein n=1 Tax=Alicyclobacillus kakegawensis TaxID=392012 RepID=UPI00083050D5|nr:PD-(D/E)XK nuclease family protein [Alicyclobacillus kakegawensis]